MTLLQSLNDLYQRQINDSDLKNIPKPGTTVEKVSWALVINDYGELESIRSLAHDDGKGSNRYQLMVVPAHDGRSGKSITPYFLCDTLTYFLGMGDDKRADQKRDAARELYHAVLGECKEPAALALLAFMNSQVPVVRCGENELNAALANGNAVVMYRSSDSGLEFLHENEAIIKSWRTYQESVSSEGEGMMGQCSVTGEKSHIARLFPLITGLPGAQSSGASLVSCNLKSFNSYSKDQAYNASISEDAAFAAGTALKLVLSDRSRRLTLGGTLVTYWSDRPSQQEDLLLSSMMGISSLSEDSEDVETLNAIRDSFEDMRKGRKLNKRFNPDVRYYILGVSPNAARIAVRFYETSTLGELAEHYGQYLRDVSMIDVKQTSLFALLRQCAVMGKYENLPSTLINPCAQALISGGRFPRSLYSTVISRMRADHASNNPWDMGQRASLLKACLVRNARLAGVEILRESELTMALNKENNNAGYLFGRLFAVMEQAQSMALGTTNATIRDKYIGAASMTPARVFPTLLHGCQNHLSKLRKDKMGMYVTLEREFDEIVGRKFSDSPFPATLSMDEQGMFFIGYYQERVELHTSHKEAPVNDNDVATN